MQLNLHIVAELRQYRADTTTEARLIVTVAAVAIVAVRPLLTEAEAVAAARRLTVAVAVALLRIAAVVVARLHVPIRRAREVVATLTRAEETRVADSFNA